ncbi:MAG TPA: hypothetical protein VGO37_18980 [Steroidobacteraceae bacterium]|jgi:hypothetical protein|nr:hypothetical protein [Steroidobacteraceae bacterium]
MTQLSRKPVPNLPQRRRIRLGWWHNIWHRLLLIGHPDVEPPLPVTQAPPSILSLMSLLEEHRGQFATAARALGAEYKGAYWMMYLLAPLAVMSSAAAYSLTDHSLLLSGIELLLIGLILMLFIAVRRGRWQDRWIQARRTAEHLRYLPLVAPFVADSQTNWYDQMASRHGMRLTVDKETSQVCAWLGVGETIAKLRLDDELFDAGYFKYVDDVLAQQVHYHARKAAMEYALTRRISRLSTSFFIVTIVCTALLFLESLLVTGDLGRNVLSHYLRFFATSLPAIGGALRGLLAQGESHRVAALSEGMSLRLSQLRAELQKMRASGAASQELEDLVWNAVQELLSEADTWMRLQESVPLSVAG